MTLVAATFATQLKDAIGFSTLVNSTDMIAFATAIINEVKGSIFSGPVSGTAPAAGPLTDGAGSGVIVGITPATLLSKFTSEMGRPATAQLSGFANAIAVNLAIGVVGFSSGNIQGMCAGGAFTGLGVNGTVSGISGSAIAAAASAVFGGMTTQLSAFCNSIASYIMSDTVAAYASGAVTGTYPPPPAVGGPMTGAGVGGTFS